MRGFGGNKLCQSRVVKPQPDFCNATFMSLLIKNRLKRETAQRLALRS